MLESGSRPRPLGGAVVLVIAALSSAGYVACGSDEGSDTLPSGLTGDASAGVGGGGGRSGQTGGSAGRGGASTGGGGGTSTGGGAQEDGSVDAATDSSADAADDAPMSNGL